MHRPFVIVGTAAALICAAALSPPAAAQSPSPLSNPSITSGAIYGELVGAAADFNNDGLEDFVSCSSSLGVVTLASPAGGYLPGTIFATWSLSVAANGALHAAGDLTGDGNADVLCSFFFLGTASATTFVYPGNGAGQFGSPIIVPDPSASGSHVAFVNPNVPGVTGPGLPAVILCSTHSGSGLPTHIDVNTTAYQSGSYSVVGSLTVVAPPPLSSYAYFQYGCAADVNGDGLLDLVGTVWTTPLQRDWVLLPGTASPPFFGAPLFVPAQFGLEAAYYVADVNNDGMTDVVARKAGTPISNQYAADDIVVYFGHPTSPLSVAAVSVIGVASSPYVVIEDVDGDGNRDLILCIRPPTSPTIGPVVFSRGDGQGHFGPGLVLQSSPAIATDRCLSADANGDGLKDVVGLFSGGTFVLYNQSRLGTGVALSNGLVPQTNAGVATPGNPNYHVGVTGATPNATAVLGVSLGLVPAPSGIMLDLNTLVLPTPQFGTFATDSLGRATLSLGLPPAPALVGQTVYVQWGVIDPAAVTGYGLSPARKIVFW